MVLFCVRIVRRKQSIISFGFDLDVPLFKLVHLVLIKDLLEDFIEVVERISLFASVLFFEGFLFLVFIASTVMLS